MRRSARTALAAALLAGGLALAGCTSKDAEERAREAAEKIQAQLKDPQAVALSQEVSKEAVKEAQRNLTAIGEYLGEINGEMDSVTVNAIEAFQTAQGMEPDGILDDDTRGRLQAAALAAEKTKPS